MQTAEAANYFSYDTLASVFIVLLAACAAIVTIDKAIKAIRSWHKPKQTAEQALLERQVACDRHFKRDLQRIEALERANAEQKEIDRVTLTTLRAILSHEINGNSIERMKEANREIDQMLINRLGGLNDGI